ncbi:hypothetical protein COLO4_08145 [Corchorus olitorius]|uniref:Protein kinase domain-containing protein n=1 Tax=Corchorus olitorius TaxID=93759 RepID=A0A1R3KHC3_9ROSI|nr:hypothetical protein COLO4_08145 [Corchorus olitorius]
MVTSKLPQSGKQLKKAFSKLFCLWRKRTKSNINFARERLGLYRRFTFKEVQAATGNFRFKIASGGYSDVFKGCIGEDEYPVAFRRFNKSERRRDEEEFLTEMESLLNLHHPHINIIPLIGYCLDGPDRFSVYEYMPRGTLSDQLHSMNDSLPWKLRLEICIGVARGLECLHTGNPVNVIIHRNIKSSNILLNQNWVPKISGFGISILMPTTTSLFEEAADIHVSTGVAGTIGYIDPEYLTSGQVTTKSDVYSFGVVLFEVVSGRKPWDIARTEMQLIPWARKCVEVKRLYEMTDPRLEGRDKIAVAPACLKAYANLAYDCTNERGNERPSIAAVVKRLQLILLLQECFEAHVPFSPSWLHSISISIAPPPGRGQPFEETQDSMSAGSPSDRSEPLVEMGDLGYPNLEFTDSDYEILGPGR